MKEVYAMVTPAFRNISYFEGQEEFKRQIIPELKKREAKTRAKRVSLVGIPARRKPLNWSINMIDKPKNSSTSAQRSSIKPFKETTTTNKRS